MVTKSPTSVTVRSGSAPTLFAPRHYLFDRLTPNDSLASIGTLQVPRACREKIAVLTASIRAAPESWALIPRSSRRFRRSKNESGAHRIARLSRCPQLARIMRRYRRPDRRAAKERTSLHPMAVTARPASRRSGLHSQSFQGNPNLSRFFRRRCPEREQNPPSTRSV